MILAFAQIGPQDLPLVGGKGLNLGALSRAGFPVPPGFCVTTLGFRAFIAGCPALPGLYDELDALGADDVPGARRLGTAVREALLQVALPAEVVESALAAWRAIGEQHAYAVRSSATAEDLPGASFAGQQDTYLNVRGEAALLDAIRRCFASLFTDRAILYRAQNGFGHREVALCVVVQRMVLAEAAGILFTADPVSGHRGTLVIEAGFGLGEALVSGLITADLYRVDRRSGALIELRLGDKAVAIRPLPGGGTVTKELPSDQRAARVLDEAKVGELRQLGLAVEAHYGGEPQDVEWCLEDGRLFLVQARPITSLYPLPEPLPKDGALHVYLSFGHAQNMTDPISPLGRDLWRAFLPFGKSRLDELPAAGEPTVLIDAGERLYLDVTSVLRVRPLRQLVSGLLQTVYPELAALIQTLTARQAVLDGPRPQLATLRLIAGVLLPAPPRLLRLLLLSNPEELPRWGDDFVERQVAAYRARVLAAAPGAPRLRAARLALSGMIRVLAELGPRMGIGLIAIGQLRSRFAGTPHAADVEALQRGLFGNVTMEMDLQVGDLADLARPHPALAEALRRGVRDHAGLGQLRELPGGSAFVAAVDKFLERFGMRGSGEIDVARPRWADEPGLLLSSVAGNLNRPELGAHRAHFQRLQSEGAAAGRRLVAATGGALAKRWAERLVRCVRYGLGMREHAKFLLVRCLAVLRAAVLEAAQDLVAAGHLDAESDVWFLHYDELLALLEGRQVGAEVGGLPALIARRRAARQRARQLIPPLVMTSEGEVPQLVLPADLPPGTLLGLGASAGVVEGVARVILDPATEVLHAGEILIAPFTDPGWTPLFVHAAGLVCDVGGMMTHGSVVAREYGIPAVVGVKSGTRRIRTGQRVRVDGSRGLVEVLEP